jgi:hypothetical protein
MLSSCGGDTYRGDVPDPHQHGDHLLPTSRLWPDHDKGPWLLTFHWQVIRDRAECVGLDIASALPDHILKERHATFVTLPPVGRPLRTTTLRELKLSELLHDERVRAEHLAVDVLGDPGLGMAYREPDRMRPATRRRLNLVASTYREARARGDKPIPAVARKLKVTRGAASNLVMRARQAGMLPSAFTEATGLPDAGPAPHPPNSGG